MTEPLSDQEDLTLRDVKYGDRFRLSRTALGHDDTKVYRALGNPTRDGQWCYAVVTDHGPLVLDYADNIEFVNDSAGEPL